MTAPQGRDKLGTHTASDLGLPELSCGQGSGPRVLDASRRVLQLTIAGGRAFLPEDGDEPEEFPGGSSSSIRPLSFYCVHVFFRGQRFRSRLVAAGAEPSFGDVFTLDLHPGMESEPPLTSLLAAEDPISIVITLSRVTPRASAPSASSLSLSSSESSSSDATPTVRSAVSTALLTTEPAALPPAVAALAGSRVVTTLVSATRLEWRGVLEHGTLPFAVELPGAGAAAAVGLSAGVLTGSVALATGLSALRDIATRAVHRLDTGVSAARVRRAVSQSAEQAEQVSKAFFVYSRRWWDALCRQHPFVSRRPVRIFAEGDRHAFRAVTTFVQPMRAGRLLDTPRHAARFVSLFPFASASRIVAGDTVATRSPSATSSVPHLHTAHQEAAMLDDGSPWRSLASMLALRSGGLADHANLLASLLLGFGLRAFVAVGTVATKDGDEQAACWVVTLDDVDEDHEVVSADTPSSKAIGEVLATFWDPITGERLVGMSARTSDGRRFLTVASLYSASALLANVQASSAVTGCCWDVRNTTAWHPMDPAMLATLRCCAEEPPALIPPSLAEGPLATAIEACVHDSLRAWRRERGLPPPNFSTDLEHTLGAALAAYEAERLTGNAFGADDFQAAIRAMTPLGSTFRAFPAQLASTSPTRIMATLEQTTVARAILGEHSHDAQFAFRARVFLYPEDTLAVWVVLAVQHSL